MQDNSSLNISSDDEKPLRSIWENAKSFITDVLDLQHGVDKRATIDEIRNKKSMAGANAWMLLCSIMIASIGLSLNSQAVIIGAMLISPLMSPILGIGLSVAINDMDTLRKSLGHFAVAILIAVLTSTIYFKLVSFVEVTPEIQARTAPNVLDVFIGIFGGLAGIISVARKDISTTLPGVAIATALMPPLCVTGFGIAHGDWEITSRSFYLFFLNTFFVALATYIVARLLDFPYKKYIKKAERRKNTIYLILFSLFLTIPSLLIFRDMIDDFNRDRALRDFESACLREMSVYLDDYEYVERVDTADLLIVKVYGSKISNDEKGEYQACLSSLGLDDVEVVILASSDVNLDHIQALKNDLSSLNTHIGTLEDKSKEQQERINRYYIGNRDSMQYSDVMRELRILYPEIEALAIGKLRYNVSDSSYIEYPTLMLNLPRRSRLNRERVREFVTNRLELDTLVVLL